MTAHALFASLAACGIVLSVTPDGRGIALPAGLATPDQRAAIVQNKAALIEFLHSIDQAQKLQPAPAITLPPPAPAKPMGWLHMDQPWRIADRLYQHHHWNCPVCMTAARAAPGTASRCAEGQRLHDDYSAQLAYL